MKYITIKYNAYKIYYFGRINKNRNILRLQFPCLVLLKKQSQPSGRSQTSIRRRKLHAVAPPAPQLQEKRN